MKLHSKENRMKIYNKCEGHCAYCGMRLSYKQFTIDHVIPLSSGGSNHQDNLLPACVYCNRLKASMTLPEFRKELLKKLTEDLQRKEIYQRASLVGLIDVRNKSFLRFYFEKRPSIAIKPWINISIMYIRNYKVYLQSIYKRCHNEKYWCKSR